MISLVLKCRLPNYSFHFNRYVPTTSIFFAFFFVMTFSYRTEVSEVVLRSALICGEYVCFLSTEICVQNAFHQLCII